MARRARAAQTPAARRIKRKILIAMALTAFLPMLVVAYLVYAYALPLLDPQAQERNLPWMLVMLGGTGLLMAAGSFMLWDLATSVVRHADALDAARRSASATGTSRPTPSPETSAVQQYVQQSDEVDTLMHSFSRMLVTIEQQASDVNEFAAPARHRVQGARVHQRPAQGVLLQGRGHRSLQPPLLLDPARGRSLALPPLQSPRLGGAPRPRRLQGGQRRARSRGRRRDAPRRWPRSCSSNRAAST